MLAAYPETPAAWGVTWSLLLGPVSAFAGWPVVESRARNEIAEREPGAALGTKAALGTEALSTELEECSTPEQAFERHFSMVWRSLRRLGVPTSAIDDAAQDVFLVLHRRWFDFQHQSSLKTWIYGILLRVASDHKRRARRERARWSPELSELESTAEQPDRLYQQREASRLLHEALSQLDDKERQIVVFVDLEEGSVVDAAEALGINLNTAYSRLRRGRQSFEKALRAASPSRASTEDGTESSPIDDRDPR